MSLTMNSLAILTVDNMGVNIIFRQPTCIHGEKTDVTLFSPHATLSPQCCVITNHTNFTTCYHQSYHFHYMLSPITPISPHVIINHTTFTICYHQSSFLCLPYRRKLDVRSSQLLPAVLPVPLIGSNTLNGCLLKPQDC